MDTVGTDTPADSAMYAMVTGLDESLRPLSWSAGPSAELSAKVAFPVIEQPAQQP
ncbi:hypothetical protein [Streptomyces acidicola]|uniref:hypothetical protein n=1 Tax=Streptomyces acidicola TaxID=2596892 RepID=UPI0038229DE0